MTKMFPTVGRVSRGYDRHQVESFLNQARDAYEGGPSAVDFSADKVRLCAFKMVRGGYNTSAVDAAMNRLEQAFLQLDRSRYVADKGTEAWLEYIALRATSLYPRLRRPAGERFDHPSNREQGYRATEVDTFLENVVAFFNEGKELTVSEVREVTFSRAKGKAAYVEGTVDAYLSRVVEILMSVE